MPRNKPVWFLWMKVNTQWRSGGFGVVGLDFPAIFEIADIYGIEVNQAVFEKLKALETQELIRQKEKSEEDSK